MSSVPRRVFNAFNHPNFGSNEVDPGLPFVQNKNDPNFGKATNGNFGVIGSGYRGPREIQFGLKFSFYNRSAAETLGGATILTLPAPIFFCVER